MALSFAEAARHQAMTTEQAHERWGSTVPNPKRLGDPDEHAILAAQIVENDFLNEEPSAWTGRRHSRAELLEGGADVAPVDDAGTSAKA